MLKLIKKMNKKDDGSFISIGPVIVTIIFIGMLLIGFTSWMTNIDRKTQLDSIARKYILAMETTGYLTADQESALEVELNEHGLNNVIFSGTTKAQQEYGEEIILSISGDMKIYLFSNTGLKANSSIGSAPVKIVHRSTAKK